jgi:hypothetical protein
MSDNLCASLKTFDFIQLKFNAFILEKAKKRKTVIRTYYGSIAHWTKFYKYLRCFIYDADRTYTV